MLLCGKNLFSRWYTSDISEGKSRKHRRHDHRCPPPSCCPFLRPSRLLGFAAQIFDGITEGRSIAERYDFLSSLTTAELARLGLSRQDISRAAVTGIPNL